MGFCYLCTFLGLLPEVLRGSQSNQWAGFAGFSWGFSVFSVSDGEMLSNLKIIVFCYLCSFLGFTQGVSVVLSPLSGWVLQGSFGVLRFECVKRDKCCRI